MARPGSWHGIRAALAAAQRVGSFQADFRDNRVFSHLGASSSNNSALTLPRLRLGNEWRRLLGLGAAAWGMASVAALAEPAGVPVEDPELARMPGKRYSYSAMPNRSQMLPPKRRCSEGVTRVERARTRKQATHFL